jgi:acyl dehydratase
MLTITSYADFETYRGAEIGSSEWLTITQEQVNAFADATLDHQWIHTDPVRASTESPFKATIAHGYLTLSLIPHLWKQIANVTNLKMEINYGIENLRFGQPVLSGSEVRLRVRLKDVADLRGTVKATMDVTLEIRDSKKSAFRGDVVFLYHFLP